MSKQDEHSQIRNDIEQLGVIIQQGFDRLEEAIRSTRASDERDETTRTEFCRICNDWSTHATADHPCEDCGQGGHEDKYEPECEMYEEPKPFLCPQCSQPEGRYHLSTCSLQGVVKTPPLWKSFPHVSTQRGGIHFQKPTLEEPTTPGAAAPQLPDELRAAQTAEREAHALRFGLLPKVPKPDVKVGDMISVTTPVGGTRRFKVTHVGEDGHYAVEPFLSPDGGHIVGPNYNTEVGPYDVPQPRVLEVDETSGPGTPIRCSCPSLGQIAEKGHLPDCPMVTGVAQ